MEEMPKFIMTIVIVLIVFVVGVFAFLTMLSPLDLEKGHMQTFDVTDPAVNQHCVLAYDPEDTTVVVKQYNGNDWLDVASTWVSVSGKTVTVDANGLQG